MQKKAKNLMKKVGVASALIATVTPIGLQMATPMVAYASVREVSLVNNYAVDLSAIEEHLKNNHVSYQRSINSDGEVELSINDQEIFKIVQKNGYEIDAPILNARANGVNKIVWRNDGGFDLYLSKNVLLLVAGTGVGVLAVALGAIFPAGVVTIISSAIGTVVGGNISHGKVFRFRKVGPLSYVYVKSWNQ